MRTPEVYEENPTAKYFGSFGAAHVQMENYVQKEGSSRINNSFVSRMAGKNSFLDGKLTVIDGAITHEIGELGETDTNHLTLYNTALAKNPGSESGKFYAEAPDTPDEKSHSMRCCSSIRLRSRPVRSSQAGIGKTIKKNKNVLAEFERCFFHGEDAACKNGFSPVWFCWLFFWHLFLRFIRETLR